MKTKKEMAKAVADRVITAEILEACLWSANKRAKNYRDEKRRYGRRGFKYMWLRDEAERREWLQYQNKDTLLSVIEPQCIHAERYKRSYWDWYEEEYVVEYRHRYYLFYEVTEKGHTFHTPIDSPEDYPELSVIEIDTLDTKGHNTADLVSNQFVTKVVNLVKSGDYEYTGILDHLSYCIADKVAAAWKRA